MAHVPDDLVTGRVEFVEQRDGELDAAEARADVPAGDGARFDEPVADLLGELRKLLAAEALEVLGAVNACQECHALPGQGIRSVASQYNRRGLPGSRSRCAPGS